MSPASVENWSVSVFRALGRGKTARSVAGGSTWKCRYEIQLRSAQVSSMLPGKGDSILEIPVYTEVKIDGSSRSYS